MVKALVLAAGYGTRLEKDIREDQSGNYQHLIGVPKPLIPVDGRPLISHWLELLLDAGIPSEDVYVVTNQHFYPQFSKWAADNNVSERLRQRHPTLWKLPASNIVNDGTTSNDNRLGACRDIQFVVQRCQLSDDLMVIGGDTLFFADFKLTDVLRAFKENGCNLVLHYPIEHDIDTLKTGVLELDERGLVVNMLEKPHPSTTASRKGCPCFYLYKRDTLQLLPQFISSAASVAEADAPGHFVSWLWSRSPCYAHFVSGRYDIGGLQTYIDCERDIVSKKASKRQ